MAANPNEHVKLTFAIMGVNLLILLIYQSITLHGMHSRFATSAICICVHAVTLGVSSTIISQTKYSYASMGLAVSIPLVLLIGIGTCAVK